MIWAILPQAVGREHNAQAVQALRLVCSIAALYLVARSWLTFRPLGTVPWDHIWPLLDVCLVTVALLFKRAPAESWLVLLYLFPVTQAAATLNLRWALLVGALAMVCYLAATGQTGVEKLRYAYATFRLFFLILMASLLTHLGREVARAHRELALADYKSQLAAEMHDGIQHYLVAIAMRLELARSLIPKDPAQAAQIAVDQRHLVRQAADELRVLVSRLRSMLLEEEGLTKALQQYVALFGQRSSVAVEVQAAGNEARLDPRAEHALLRIAQEALTNVVKYAQATHVVVSLEFETDYVRCTVRDDGVGFDPAQLPGEPGLGGGFGMETMQRRAAAMNGTCEVTSKPGEGTTVTVRMPYRPG